MTPTVQLEKNVPPRWTQDDWQRGYRSLREETAYWVEDIEGAPPRDLRGTLLRNGPALLERGGQSVQHPFDGDGMICAFTFPGDGRVHFRNRYVRTEGFLAEEKADRFLYRGVFGTQKPGGWLSNAFDIRPKNIANTNVIFRNGKILALWEGGKPYALEPNRLETLGVDDLNGTLAGGAVFSAHPKVDPSTGNLINFGVNPGLYSTITLYELDSALAVVSRREYQVPGFAFIHDFALTDKYAIFFQNPVTINPLPYWFGTRGAAESLVFQPNQPTRIHLIPRNGGPLKTLETDAFFVFHHANAWQNGDALTIDSIAYETFPQIEPGTNYREVNIEKIVPSQLWRFTIDLMFGKVRRERLAERAVEFPALHPQAVGRTHKRLFLAAADSPTGNAPLQAVVSYDAFDGKMKVWSAAPRGFVGEPLFVPFPGAAGETEGWLLTMIFDAARNASELVVLDARDVEAGPVARIRLRQAIPYGLHGNFTPDVISVEN
jgi:all-trans-8'-apo-beta-carotenal 15,15'-oxygenase